MELKNEVGLYLSWCAVYREIVGNITNQNGSGKELGSLVALLQDFDKKLHAYENDESREALKQLNEKITTLIALFSEKHLNECVRLLQSIEDEILWNLSPKSAIANMPLPAEILLHTASYLPLRGLESLSSSCQFFNQHETIWRKIAKKKAGIKLVAGEDFSFVLLPNDQLFGFGANYFGQLGLGHTANQSTPQFIPMPLGARPCQISAGTSHSLVLCDDGSVYGFGANFIGQLGLGHNTNQSTPQLISMPLDAKPCQVDAGFAHSLILCEDGSVYGFGYNHSGELGLGHNTNQSTPQLISMPLDARPCQVSAGYSHSLILCEDGSVYGFGNNAHGQLGLRHNTNQSTPQLIPMPLLARPCQISAGHSHSLILCDDGSVYGFGFNARGQLGLRRNSSQSTPQLIPMPRGARPCQISAGSHSLILCGDGSVYGFGTNELGQLGLGHNTDQFTPQFIPMPLDARPCQIFAGASHSFILCNNGSAYGFGANAKGQLGLGHENNHPTPQLISFFSSIESQENMEEKNTSCVRK